MARADEVMALYRSRFPSFLRFAFRELNAGQPLVETPHIDGLADHLDRVARGEITRLLITMPPRSLKSVSASVALPVWLLGRNPSAQIISVAGTRDLASDFETATRALMASPRCRALYPHVRLEGRPGCIQLPHGGRRFTATVGATLTGRGADLIVIDDPIPPAAAHDAASRNEVTRWFHGEVIQRLNDKKKCAVIVIMERLHVDDLAGHLLSREQAWTHLNMPAIAVAEERWPLADGRIIVRRPGDALATGLESRQQLLERMLDIGAYNFGAQYQQAPPRTMSADEMRGGCFSAGDDQWGFPDMRFGRVSEREIMAHEVFGVGDRHPAVAPRPITRAEWERYARWTVDYQRRLKEDPKAKFGPPADEVWPPEPTE